MRLNLSFLLSIFIILIFSFQFFFITNAVLEEEAVNVGRNPIDNYVKFKINGFSNSDSNKAEFLLNQTMKEHIFGFLKRSQNDGTFSIPSMDYAYFLGMSLFYLSEIQAVDFSDLVNEIISFVENSRNSDGGYGNWEDSRSSMESTFQAIQIYRFLNNFSNLNFEEANNTINFVQKLKTNLFGYFPLEDWDVPDISSTYRALWIKSEIKNKFPSISIGNDTDIESFLLNNFIPPFFINSGSGYSEVFNGEPEILASLYSINSFSLLNKEDPNGEKVAQFLDSLTSANGGVSGRIGDSSTTGYTSNGLETYFALLNYTTFDFSQIISESFVDLALNYLKANKAVGSGFTSSDRDSTPELKSTFFVLKSYYLLFKNNLLPNNIDLSGVFQFLILENDINFGFGDYPSDVPQLTHTVNAYLAGKLLDNISWINPVMFNYIRDCYDETNGAYGFRPLSSGFVKYTYYALRALRTTNKSIETQTDIKQFLINSQNEDGGFGQNPNALLSYLTHTFWAINSLYMLNEIDSLHYNVVSFLEKLKNSDGTFSNFPGVNGTLASTYRAFKVFQHLNKPTIIPNHTLQAFLSPSGGFYPAKSSTTPTMESTYYGVYLSILNNFKFNETKIRQFVFSLYNEDGGFGLRPGFTSRVTSTYYAIGILYLLDNIGNVENIKTEDPIDFFSPIINPSFIPAIDTNKTYFGTFKTTALIFDAESEIKNTWSQLIWISSTENRTIPIQVKGEISDNSSDLYSFYLGPFHDDGILYFRLLAEDSNGNVAITEWFSIITLKNKIVQIEIKIDYLSLILEMIIPFILSIVLVEIFLSKKRIKKRPNNEVKSMLQKESENPRDSNSNVIYIMTLISIISIGSRLLLSDSLIVLNQSLFLFRFIFGILVILIAKYVFGLKMLGLFGPVILVIAMMSVGPLWGLLIFLNLFIMNYVVRVLIRPLNFPVGFRIGLMMIFTIVTIGFLEQLGEIFLISFLSGSILVPIIITPWFTDRFVTEIEQNNQYNAFLRLAITLLISLIAYSVMNITELVSFVVFNPETWVLIVFVVLYFGRVQEYSLMDKRRFNRLFNREENPLTIMVRNRDYIAKYNQAFLFPFINKFNMKNQFEKWQVPTPELLGIIENEGEISETIKRLSFKREGFVIKPSQSFGGKGILIISEVTSEGYFVIKGEKYTDKAIETEIKKIIRGEYLTSQTTTENDICLIEEKIIVDSPLSEISKGLPDIRIIVFRGIPIMAMARLPTLESDGKANLKQGAIGAGIEIDTGKIFRAEWKGVEVTNHPDTKNKISGFQFQHWKQILAVACLAQKSTGLGYAGVDIVINDKKRLLVLEVNKRPGLEIQNINQKSLLSRFRFIEDQEIESYDLSPLKSAQIGIDLSQNNWRVS